jgi:radical SAM-linked protein
MGRRQPEGPPPAPIVQRIRIQYAKRGRMRFSSHRDFSRAFERSLRRAGIPMAYSAGFHPHPKISYVGASPTGVGSEAEYLEIALAEHREPAAVVAAIDAVLPAGLDLVFGIDVVLARPGSLPERMEVSLWRLELRDDHAVVRAACEALLRCETAPVERATKDGRRTIDARPAIVTADVSEVSGGDDGPGRAIIDLVVRQVTPAVRPDDVLAALHSVAGFAPSQPPRATRLAQGPLLEDGSVGDPLRMTMVDDTETPVSTR